MPRLPFITFEGSEGSGKSTQADRLAARLQRCGVPYTLAREGTPKTKHNTSNVQIYVDDSAGTARSRSYYAVTQATPDLPLQVIVTGHYHDTFHRVDGAWWFDTRTMFVDQVGDMSHHLKF